MNFSGMSPLTLFSRLSRLDSLTSLELILFPSRRKPDGVDISRGVKARYWKSEIAFNMKRKVRSNEILIGELDAKRRSKHLIHIICVCVCVYLYMSGYICFM